MYSVLKTPSPTDLVQHDTTRYLRPADPASPPQLIVARQPDPLVCTLARRQKRVVSETRIRQKTQSLPVRQRRRHSPRRLHRRINLSVMPMTAVVTETDMRCYALPRAILFTCPLALVRGTSMLGSPGGDRVRGLPAAPPVKDPLLTGLGRVRVVASSARRRALQKAHGLVFGVGASSLSVLHLQSSV